MKPLTIISAILISFSITQGCYLTCHSSAVGDFACSHSEPKNHGGAVKRVNWSHKGCDIIGTLANGCGVTVASSEGCGHVAFTIAKPGRRMVRWSDAEE